MESKLFLANIFRRIARIFSIIVILLSVPFLLFVVLQVISGESANIIIFLALLLMVCLLAGLIIAWRKEFLGATIALISIIGYFFLSGSILPGVGSRQGFAMLAGPINLLFALLIPGYHLGVSPTAKLVPVISWVLLLVPIALFFSSWWLRKNDHSSKTQKDISATSDVKREE